MGGSKLRIRLAGECTIASEGRTETTSVPTRQARLVLARLALARGPVSQDELADLLWSGSLPSSWERHLSAVVSKLRHLLRTASGNESSRIAGRPGAYELELPPGSAVDVVEAELGVQRARALLRDGRLEEALAAASAAAEIARRPLLPGAEGLWVDEQRESLRSALLEALDIEVAVAVERGDATGLKPAREAIALDPHRESAYGNLMRIHLAIGERSAAAEVFERCRLALEELGLQPSAELEDLYRSALDASMRPHMADAEGNTLPLSTTTFVGRDADLDAVSEAFERSRLVTLTGPGGVGKSRLALQAAHRMADRHEHGAWLCELARIAEPSGVAFAVASAVGVRQRQGATIEESLIEALADRSTLIVVDNCEHVLDAVASLLERIVRYCPYVCLLATSRERTSAEGEVVLDVTPLAVPDEGIDPVKAWDDPAPALELLRDRIADARPGFHPDERGRAALVAVARRLDGLPLALELAAPRTAAMGPIEVDRRLDRRFALLDRGRRTALERHRSLQAAVEWSYDLLGDEERLVFERASVFIGGCTLEAAEFVCSSRGGVRADDVSGAFTGLVEKSMLIVDDRGPQTRYRMLETLREFARERLADRDDLAVTEQAHALNYAALAWKAEDKLRGPQEPDWVPIVETELGNLRAAHSWGLRSRRRDVAAEISAALFTFAHFRTRTDIYAWADQLADEEPEAGNHYLSRAVAAAADGAMMRGDLARARKLADRAIAMAGTDPVARFGWHVLGAVALFEGHLDESCEAIRHWADLARQVEDHYHATDALGTRAVVKAYSGDQDAAITAAEEAADEAACCRSPSALAWASYVRGEVLAATDPDAAMTYLDRAVELADVAGSHFVRGVALLSATSLRARHGDPATAAPALSSTIALWERAGNWRQQWITLRSAVELFTRLGKDRAAARLLGAIDARDAASVFGDDAIRLNGIREALRERLGTAFDSLAAEGGVMEPSDVLSFTRRELAGSRDG